MSLILDDYSAIGALGGAVEGFARGFADSQDRKMKQMEFQAKQKAEEREVEREQFRQALDLRKANLIKNAQGQLEVDPQARQREDLDYRTKGLIVKRDENGNVIESSWDPDAPTVIGAEARKTTANRPRIVGPQKPGGGLLGGGVGGKPSPAQTTVDREFGKDYAEYIAAGGKGSIDKNLSLLEDAITELEQPGDITGGVTGTLLGDKGQDIANKPLASIRDKVRTAIQSSLKTILGGQYTEKEGRDIFNRAFNPALSDKENIDRARRELNALRARAEAKEAAAKYYEANNTIMGYKGLISSGLIPKDDQAAKERQRLEELRRKAAGQ